GLEHCGIARPDEAEAHPALLSDGRVVQVMRLDEALEVAAAGDVTEPALVDEAVVNQRIDDPVAENPESHPGAGPPGALAHHPRRAEREQRDAQRRADQREAVV